MAPSSAMDAASATGGFDAEEIIDGAFAIVRSRLIEIVESLREGRTRIDAMVAVLYRDVDPRLHPAAARSVFAHIVHMLERGMILCDGAPDLQASYSLAAPAPA